MSEGQGSEGFDSDSHNLPDQIIDPPVRQANLTYTKVAVPVAKDVLETDFSTIVPGPQSNIFLFSVLSELPTHYPTWLEDTIFDGEADSMCVKFYLPNSLSEAFDTPQFSQHWMRVTKSILTRCQSVYQGSVGLELISKAYRSFLYRNFDEMPAVVQEYLANDPLASESQFDETSPIGVRDEKQMLRVVASHLLGRSMTEASLPDTLISPWSLGFLLQGNQSLIESGCEPLTYKDLNVWVRYLTLKGVSIARDLSMRHPFTPWGQKLFMYFHLRSAMLSQKGKETMMKYWILNQGEQYADFEFLNSAWRRLCYVRKALSKERKVKQVRSKKINTNTTKIIFSQVPFISKDEKSGLPMVSLFNYRRVFEGEKLFAGLNETEAGTSPVEISFLRENIQPGYYEQGSMNIQDMFNDFQQYSDNMRQKQKGKGASFFGEGMSLN